MENQLSSGRTCSQDLHHCRFFRGSRIICKSGTSNNLEIGSSSCQCSTTSNWTRKENEETCVSNAEKTQDVREEILARTLDVSRPCRRKEVLWKLQLHTWGKMKFYRFTDGTTIQGNRSPSFHKCQCFESWSHEKVERNRNHTLQCGCFGHRTLIPNHSLSKSAQYQRSSLKLVWRVRSEAEWERAGRVRNKRRPRGKKILKSVNAQEGNSLVCAPRTEPASGNRLRESLQKFESLSKTVQFTKVCEDASFWHRVSAGMSYKTIPDVDDGFGDFIPACREPTFPRTSPRSRAGAAILGGTLIGPVIEVHVVQLLGNHGLKSKFHLQIIQNEHLGLWYVEARIDLWTRNISQIQETISAGRNEFRNKQSQQKVNLVLQNWSHPSLRKLMRDQSGLLLIQHPSKGSLFHPRARNWSWDWCAIMIKKIEKLTEQFIGIRQIPNCWEHLDQKEHEIFRRRIGFNTVMKEVTRRNSSENSQHFLIYVRAIQGHTGGNMMAPELMGDVIIPYN